MIIADAPVEEFEEIDSTLLEARRRAAAGHLGPVWLVAKRQISGQGRRGRTWASLDGNLMTTYLAPTRRTPAELALVGFAAGLAIAEGLEQWIGPGRAALKWPNDVLIDGAKAAGVLLDSGATRDGAAWAALSFGVNLASAPDAIDQPTMSLQRALESEPAPAPRAFLDHVRTALLVWDQRLLNNGFAPLRQAWLNRAHGLGQQVRVAAGASTMEGRIAGLSARGELELETDAGPRLIAAGDILLPQHASV